MTLEEFKSSISSPKPLNYLTPLLKALWYDGKGDWNNAHTIAQDVSTNEGSWIHGYLHRKEGDNPNAAYWYSRAKKKFPTTSLEEEWEIIVTELLSRY